MYLKSDLIWSSNVKQAEKSNIAVQLIKYSTLNLHLGSTCQICCTRSTLN